MLKLLNGTITQRGGQEEGIDEKRNAYVDTQKCFSNQPGKEGNKGDMNV